MTYALMSSGGKDSTLALDRVRREGIEVHYLVNICDEASERVRLHGVPQTLIAQQAESLGLEPILARATPSSFEAVFLETLEHLAQLEIHGIVFGSIHLRDVRSWYEERVTAAGLQHVEPIWGEPAIELAWEVVERGYQALVVSVDTRQAAENLLGREFDADLVTEMGCTDDLDPGGERGEYHTFVYDGPEFHHPVPFSIGATLEAEGHRFIDLIAKPTG